MTAPSIHPRATCQFKLDAETYRLRSSQIFYVGRNMQNWEKGSRRVIVADGWTEELNEKCIAFVLSNYEDFSLFTDEELDYLRIFLQCDQAGAEALIVAYLCRAGKFRDLFLNGIKPHVYIGLAFPHHWEEQHPYIHEIRKLPIKDIKNHPNWSALKDAIAGSDNNPPATRYYYHYKQTCHSANYGIKENTFQMNMLEKSGGKVVLSTKQAGAYLEGYRTEFPEIPGWNREVQEAVKKAPHMLWSLHGFPREFVNIKESDMKDVIAWIPQCTVGCITHIAYTNLQDYIEDYQKRWDLLNNSHDSYCNQVSLREIRDCGKKMTEFMNQDLMSPRGEPFRMKSELQIGFNWAPAKDPTKDKKFDGNWYSPENISKYNLLGLREVKFN